MKHGYKWDMDAIWYGYRDVIMFKNYKIWYNYNYLNISINFYKYTKIYLFYWLP